MQINNSYSNWQSNSLNSYKHNKETINNLEIRNSNIQEFNNSIEISRVNSDKLINSMESSENHINKLSESFKLSHIRTDELLNSILQNKG